MRSFKILTLIVSVLGASMCGAQSTAYVLGAEATNVDRFGWSVADAGDIDGDGPPDVLVGSPESRQRIRASPELRPDERPGLRSRAVTGRGRWSGTGRGAPSR